MFSVEVAIPILVILNKVTACWVSHSKIWTESCIIDIKCLQTEWWYYLLNYCRVQGQLSNYIDADFSWFGFFLTVNLNKEYYSVYNSVNTVTYLTSSLFFFYTTAPITQINTSFTFVNFNFKFCISHCKMIIIESAIILGLLTGYNI